MQTKPPTPEQKKALDKLMAESAMEAMANDLRAGRVLLTGRDNGIHISHVIQDEIKHQREITIEEIKSKIDKETLFLFSFVPFVIAEIAWDYADSCINLAILLRIYETKRLSRRIRELRREYDWKRSRMDPGSRKIETENMLAFQEDYKEFFSHLHHNIQEQINATYPGQCFDMQLLISGAYSCAVVLRSVFKYVDIMQNKIAALLGITAVGSIIVSELRELEKIIIQFAGEESIGGDNKFPTSLNPYVDTLVNYLLESEIVELPCPTK